ncbi:hypothetical protein [Streptomyces sp. enrichment culture]|uniref:hypothetical protein n=1 Tax=Streptomyces sp. enrichment culture TaxID=1795815 RepID=UPI003F57AEC3
MGLDITVLIADWAWLGAIPVRERLERLRDAWYDDATGLWDPDAPVVDAGWVRPRGAGGERFAVYEFRHTCGSFKPHFWAGHRWESLRGHVDAPVRSDLDALLAGLIWAGPDGEATHTDPEVFGDDPSLHGLLLARSPDGVRELAATWRRARPALDGLEGPFTAHAAGPDGWVGDFAAYRELLAGWGTVVTEAARRGWAVVGLSE